MMGIFCIALKFTLYTHHSAFHIVQVGISNRYVQAKWLITRRNLGGNISCTSQAINHSDAKVLVIAGVIGVVRIVGALEELLLGQPNAAVEQLEVGRGAPAPLAYQR